MRSSTRLDSAVFQLTPTRTRCDLVVSANGKTEKIATGLLNPFLAHLKTAQDQMAKGGYSITLEPGRGVDADWFTKSTVERFVRFVSTPEVLERIYTVESEISQITEAIAFQNANDLGVEDHKGKPVESLEGSRPISDSNEERAIVLYKPEAHPPEANGSISQEGNSKVQLLKVLETRKTMLEKEQGMAFARAVAAGFDIDHMAPLISFAECFGASRLMDACKRFLELWKRKHETGQWLEMEAAAQVSMNDVSLYSELSPESHGKATTETSIDKKPPMEHQSPQSHFPPHPMYAPWAVQSPNGAVPVFQVYPAQGMPYYSNYPVNSPYFHPPYPSEDPRLKAGQRTRQKRHSDDDDGSQDEMELEEGSENRDSQKKSGRLGKKRSGKVVIQNVNYITSKRQSSSGSESESVSGSESDKEDGSDMKNRKSMRPVGTLNSTGKQETENWNAFQDFLLRDAAEDKGGSPDESMFSNEKEVQVRRGQSLLGDDPLSNGRLDDGKFMNGQMGIEMDNGKGAYKRSTNDDFMIHRRENRSSLDPLAMDRFEHANNNSEMNSSLDMDAASIVPFRGMSSNQVGNDERKAIDMGWVEKAKSNQVGIHVNYEPHDLSLMPERGTERGPSGYDPALDYEMQVCAEDIASLEKKNNEDKQGSKKLVKEGKKLTPDSSGKKKTVGPIRKGKPSKLSPLDEARARAEKLRTYKADLLKLKKEKEEEEKKRLEHLKIERQKRIAARGGSSTVPAHSSSVPQQTQRQLPAKLSTSTHKRSKFSDTDPGSSSPLQRSTRPASLGSSDNQKVSRTGNKISQSVSSLPESTKQKSSDTKPSMARIRRLSEPKMSLSSVQSRSVEPISKPKSTGPESKKISAIVNLDKTKAATLPVLKIRTSKGPDTDKIVNESKPSITSETAELKRNSGKNSHHNEGDDNTVIEKNVVSLECEKPSGPAAVHAPVSPIAIDGIKRLSIEHQKHAQPNPFEVTTVNAETESLKYSSVDASEKQYQPPYARISSMEDPCTQNSEYGKAPPESVAVLTTSMETVKVSSDSENLKLEKIPEALEKTHVKGSPSKGFKHLLKFGRKNHSSASSDHNAESDNSSAHGSEADHTASGEVHTLKNLISQDETPKANATPQKPSRSFSLLSPFRNKSSEKKLIT